MCKGITPNIANIINDVARLECIKPYTLCGGTALAIQLGHRLSEDLDFMMWRLSRTEKPEVDWPVIEKEIEQNVGAIEHRDILGFDQVAFWVKGVKISFFVSDNFSPVQERIPYKGNIFLSDVPAILAMKMEVMLRRSKYRDYYDIYSIVKSGYSLREGMNAAIRYSGNKLNMKSLMIMLSNCRIPKDAIFPQMSPIYDVSLETMREYLVKHIDG